jgi:hypothetical protein
MYVDTAELIRAMRDILMELDNKSPHRQYEELVKWADDELTKHGQDLD